MNEPTDAPSIFAPLWKRKWLILAVGLLVAAGTYLYYKRQTHVYSATTQLFLGGGAEEQAQLTGGGGSRRKSGALVPTNQAALINSNVVKELVHRRLRAQHKPDARVALKGKARAAAKEKNDFITITAQAKNAKGAALLANTTAQVYIKRQTANYQREVQASIALARRQLRRIEAVQETALAPPTGTAEKNSKATTPKSAAKGASSTAVTLQAASLSAKINQLESQLYFTNVKQIEPAKPARAHLVKPKPRKNAIFGFAVGLLLASIVAYVLSRLDRRLRSLTQIEAVFQLPILTALPVVRRPVVRQDGQPLPAGPLREPIWRLQMALKMGAPSLAGAAPVVGPRAILLVSADPGDGKSTLVANLALVQRDAGEDAAVLEADFRRPVQARLLGAEGSRGLADVLEGRLALEQALQQVAGGSRRSQPASSDAAGGGGVATLVESSKAGSVSVLLGGGAVSNPPALLARPELPELLRSMTADFDSVLVDAPVPLQVSDVMPLLRVVDGIVIVARVGHTSESSARRLVELLARSASAPVLGVAANAVPAREIHKYGFSSASGRPRWLRALTGR
jgi:Mrp family chromosome partitioning ATPase/capsular polysaccharide biosynthesis protein